MGRAYFVVSDLHLCDIEEHTDGWKAYKSARFVVDRELAVAVGAFLRDGPASEERVVVLNGDIIDFDLVTAVPDDPPWALSRAERRRGMDPTERKSVWKLRRVLNDHPRFVGMLAQVLAAGHRVVYVMGNHDRELHFPAVQRAFVAAVTARAHTQGVRIEPDQLVFEPWFFHVPGEIYAEHGQQYDDYTSFRYILAPTTPGRREPTLTLPMGNLSNRELMSEMGFFNPHASNYILSVYRYLAHWLRHYAFSRRNIATRWLLGSFVVMAQLIRNKRALLRAPPDHDRLLQAYAQHCGLAVQTVRALDRLKRQPITNRWYRVAREFWLDRTMVAALMLGGTLVLALSPIPLWVQLMVPLSSFPLLFLIYERFAHGETIFSAEAKAGEYARAIASLVRTRVVTFGHSHTPVLFPLGAGVTYVNTGTWAPVSTPDARATAPGGDDPGHASPSLRNALIARFDGDAVTVALDSWMHVPPPTPQLRWLAAPSA